MLPPFLYRKYILFFLLFSTLLSSFFLPYSHAASSEKSLLEEYNDFITNANQEELEALDLFLDDMGRVRQHFEEIREPVVPPEHEPIKWKSLALFIVCTIGCYMIYQHGVEILNFIESALSDMSKEIIDTSLVLAREAARAKVRRLLEDPSYFPFLQTWLPTQTNASA